MKAKVYRLNSGVSRLFLFALIAVMPGLVQAQSATDGQAVKALTTDASGALLVLRNSGLLAVEGQSTTEIPLPPSDSGAPPRSMAKGADESLPAIAAAAIAPPNIDLPTLCGAGL